MRFYITWPVDSIAPESPRTYEDSISTAITLRQLRQPLRMLLALLSLPPIPLSRHDPQYPLPSVKVRQREVELPVESARSPERGIDGVRTVRGADDDDLSTVVHAVHQREERRHDGGVDLVLLR